ncbi:MAG TPA: hypothetical protein VGL77_03815 [Armatimonadota bacterium]|jgi:hypothetical protein
MANRHNHHEPILTKPLPGRTVPVVVILCLIASLVLGYRYFFGAPTELLGGPPPANEYAHYLQEKPRPAPVTPPPADVATPAVTPPLTDTSAATATTTVATPPADKPTAPKKKKPKAPAPADEQD